MSNWEKNVRKVVPYVPGEQPHEAGMIKLNTNENPYPPSPKAAEAIRRVAEEDTLRLYPDRGRTGAGDCGCLPRKHKAGFCRRWFG